jgi:hypothetical protein
LPPYTNSMQEYKINENEARKILWRIRVLLPLIAICGCIVVLVLYFLSEGKVQAGDYTVPATTILITIVLIVVWRQSVKANAEYFGSYRLIITEEAVVEEAMHKPGVNIEKSKIGIISAAKDGSITIVSRSGRKFIRIPKNIDNKEDLHTALNAIKPISAADAKPIITLLRNGVILLSLVCGAVAALSENEKILAFCGITMGCIITGGSISIIVSNTADPKIKLIAKIVLGVMVLGLISTILLKVL